MIRSLRRASARLADGLARSLSFQHTRQRLNHGQGLQPAPEKVQDLLEPLLWLIAQHRVGNRPGRIEPRAVKRRPKPYPLLMLSRTPARESIRRFGHPDRQAGESIQPIAA